MHATCRKFNKALHLASSKQPPDKKRDRPQLFEASVLVNVHQPPLRILADVPLTTGQTVQSLHPGSHQDTLSGVARPTSRQPRSPRHNIRARHTYRAFPAGPQPTRILRKTRFKRKECRATRLVCWRDDALLVCSRHRSYPALITVRASLRICMWAYARHGESGPVKDVFCRAGTGIYLPFSAR
jgi:hypothetical protein